MCIPATFPLNTPGVLFNLVLVGDSAEVLFMGNLYTIKDFPINGNTDTPTPTTLLLPPFIFSWTSGEVEILQRSWLRWKMGILECWGDNARASSKHTSALHPLHCGQYLQMGSVQFCVEQDGVSGVDIARAIRFSGYISQEHK
jgi:hypothetical protein